MGFKLGSARKGSSSRLNAQANIAVIVSGVVRNISPYSADYLIIGGGGGGGSSDASNFAGGGGGAGGFISGAATLTAGNTYIVTIGGGGTTSGANTPSVAFTEVVAIGGNTTLFGNAINFTAIGGGWGATQSWTVPAVAMPAAVQRGGNAATGGGMTWNAIAPIGRAIGRPGIGVVGKQGWPGGGSITAGGGGAGGGGGSGGAGGAITSPPTQVPGAAGGLGNVWTLTGPTIRYAGGGAGGSLSALTNNANVIALGGGQPTANLNLKGGGGDGGGGKFANGSPGPLNATNGINNTGGGGGGAGIGGPDPTAKFSGGAGGSGVVKIAIPSLIYLSTSYTGSVTVEESATSPGKTIITFNSSGTLTA